MQVTFLEAASSSPAAGRHTPSHADKAYSLLASPCRSFFQILNASGRSLSTRAPNHGLVWFTSHICPDECTRACAGWHSNSGHHRDTGFFVAEAVRARMLCTQIRCMSHGYARNRLGLCHDWVWSKYAVAGKQRLLLSTGCPTTGSRAPG
jgi:hypothetical protein